MMHPVIKIKRIYDDPEKEDGLRILVDRLWPRGITKELASIDHWEKDLAPTTALRTWFGHRPELWPEFQKRYKAELQKNTGIDSFVKKHKTIGVLTLVYASRDETHSHVVVLKDYLERLFSKVK